MSKLNKLGNTATTVRREGRTTFIKYHLTDVVKFTYKTVVLDSHCWKTATTKTRMNQASRQFSLGYSVWQEKGVWFVSSGGKTIEFKDKMVIKRTK